MTGTTDTQFSPFTETFGDTLTQLVDGAAKVARESTKSYVAGLNAIVKQQRFAYDASQQWVSAVVSAQSKIRQQLVESYDSAKGQLVNTAEDATKPAGEAGVDVAESSRDAARAPRKQSRPVTKTSRRSAPTKSKPASTNGRRPGPAKWTNEAYEALTAVEVIDKMPQLSQRELREVETYEKAHQARHTVLRKLASLRGQEPMPGYDELNVRDIHTQLADGDTELAARVRGYERPHKNRDGVLNAANAESAKS